MAIPQNFETGTKRGRAEKTGSNLHSKPPLFPGNSGSVSGLDLTMTTVVRK